MEIWKDIPGYEGLYQVSNMGRARSLDRWITQKHAMKEGHYTRLFPGKLMNPFPDKRGYQYISLSKNGITKRGCVHYLVLKTFVGERPLNYDCNHLNGKKGDNRLGNLEYCTKSENMRHALDVLKIVRRSGTIGEKHHKAKLTDNDIVRIRKLYSSKQYIQKQLAKIFGVSQRTISLIVRGEGWKHLKAD